MRHNMLLSARTVVLLSVFLFSNVFGPNNVRADDNGIVFSKRAAGTFLLHEALEGGSRIVTITADGRWFGIHSTQFKYDFTDQQGSWVKIGNRTIKAGALNFSLLQDGVGSALFVYIVEFDDHYRQVSGELLGKIFAPGVDPLDPESIPIETMRDTFTGKRLRLDPSSADR